MLKLKLILRILLGKAVIYKVKFFKGISISAYDDTEIACCTFENKRRK